MAARGKRHAHVASPWSNAFASTRSRFPSTSARQWTLPAVTRRFVARLRIATLAVAREPDTTDVVATGSAPSPPRASTGAPADVCCAGAGVEAVLGRDEDGELAG